MKAHVYILQSEDSKKFYIGSTISLDQRLAHHYAGHTPSTRRLGKVKLVFAQEYPTLREARIIEKRLKRLKRHDYIEKIVVKGKLKCARSSTAERQAYTLVVLGSNPSARTNQKTPRGEFFDCLYRHWFYLERLQERVEFLLFQRFLLHKCGGDLFQGFPM